KRVDFLRQSRVDLTPTDYIEYSGIAGTVISGAFSFDILRHLVKRHAPRVELDWNKPKPERLGATLPRLLPLLYEDSLVEANIPYLTWLHAAKARKKRSDLEWLVQRFERLKLPGRQKAELFDSLELHIKWELDGTRASRTLNKRRVPHVFYHNAPLIRRSEISLDKEFESPPIELQKLTPRQGQ